MAKSTSISSRIAGFFDTMAPGMQQRGARASPRHRERFFLERDPRTRKRPKPDDVSRPHQLPSAMQAVRKPPRRASTGPTPSRPQAASRTRPLSRGGEWRKA